MARPERCWNGPLGCCCRESETYPQIGKDAEGTDRAIKKSVYYLPRVGYYLLSGGYPSRIELDILTEGIKPN